MKIKDLKAVLTAVGERYDDWDLNILLSIPSIGGRASCGVRSIGFGFDWEIGKVLINPVLRLSKKTESEDVYHGATEFLLWLASKPVKRESYEIREAKRILLSAGYTEERIKEAQKFLHGT